MSSWRNFDPDRQGAPGGQFKFSKPHFVFLLKYESLKYICDYSTLLKRHWFGVNNFINTGVD